MDDLLVFVVVLFQSLFFKIKNHKKYSSERVFSFSNEHSVVLFYNLLKLKHFLTSFCKETTMSCGPTNFCLIYAQPPTKVKELAPLPKSNKKSGKERRPKKLRKNNNAILYHQFQTFSSFKFNLRIYM